MKKFVIIPLLLIGTLQAAGPLKMLLTQRHKWLEGTETIQTHATLNDAYFWFAMDQASGDSSDLMGNLAFDLLKGGTTVGSTGVTPIDPNSTTVTEVLRSHWVNDPTPTTGMPNFEDKDLSSEFTSVTQDIAVGVWWYADGELSGLTTAQADAFDADNYYDYSMFAFATGNFNNWRLSYAMVHNYDDADIGYWNGSSFINSGQADIMASETPQLWHLTVFNWDSTDDEITIWLDGTKIRTYTMGANNMDHDMNSADTTFQVGRYCNWDRRFSGYFNGAFCYSRSLTDAEQADLWNGGAGLFPSR